MLFRFEIYRCWEAIIEISLRQTFIYVAAAWEADTRCEMCWKTIALWWRIVFLSEQLIFSFSLTRLLPHVCLSFVLHSTCRKLFKIKGAKDKSSKNLLIRKLSLHSKLVCTFEKLSNYVDVCPIFISSDSLFRCSISMLAAEREKEGKTSRSFDVNHFHGWLMTNISFCSILQILIPSSSKNQHLPSNYVPTNSVLLRACRKKNK